MRGRRPFRLVLVALAVLAALSHVCALPIQATAHHEPAAPHAPPTDSHDDGASCEAAARASSHAGLPFVPVVAVAAEPVLPAPASAVPVAHPVPCRSSPLFLLHLTLRI
jgi:hypothetical protein